MTGVVRVLTSQCETCIFRPGNLMHLDKGRLADMIRECKEKDAHVPCHETIDYSRGKEGTNCLEPGPAAICAGFAERYEPTILQLAHRLDAVSPVDPPKDWHG